MQETLCSLGKPQETAAPFKTENPDFPKQLEILYQFLLLFKNPDDKMIKTQHFLKFWRHFIPRIENEDRQNQ